MEWRHSRDITETLEKYFFLILWLSSVKSERACRNGMCILYSLMEPQLHIAITALHRVQSAAALHIGRNAKSQKRSLNSMTMPKKSFERRKNMSKAIFGSHQQSRGGQNVCTGWQVLPDPSSSWLASPTLHSAPDNFF